MDRPNAWKEYTEEQLDQLHYLCEGYKAFISENKTERECCSAAVTMAEEAGYVSLQSRIEAGKRLVPGDKVYAVNRDKTLMLLQLGTEPLEAGVNILGAHVDSPRLDVKQDPVEEKNELVTLDTHYYGGVKKYQWVTMPLAIHGVVAKKDGTVVSVVIGEDDDDPVFCITDLLPHLASEQMGKKATEVIEGEMLDVLVGNRPIVVKEGEKDGDAEKSPVKAGVLGILRDLLDIEEEDLLSAELEVVPAGAARDLGLDRSMILGYGQDDRVCAYTSLVAQLDAEAPARTAVTLLVDKEEIGSMGVTGMQSAAFDTFMQDLCEGMQTPLRVCYERSFCLSADVTAAYDPNFDSVYEKRNAARVNHGLCLCKYTGARGKSGSSDADAETVAYARRVLDGENVVWQISEMGKVDAGGGGTVAQYMANRNITTLDAGVPVLSMHAPFETVAKLDCYETYRGCMAVYLG